MLFLPQAIAIGATNRNCGKTTYICGLLSRFKEHKPIAIKIKTVYPDDSKWHGTGTPLVGDFELREENAETGKKDSVRMLQAGAAKVFYLKTKNSFLEVSITEMLKDIPKDQPIIIESNSLLEIFKPALFLMIKSDDKSKFKPSALKFMDQADLVLDTDGESYSLPPSELPLSWSLNKWLMI